MAALASSQLGQVPYSGQASIVLAGQSNNIGMQNYPLTRLNLHNKASTYLESTGGNSGQAFNASWLTCG